MLIVKEQFYAKKYDIYKQFMSYIYSKYYLSHNCTILLSISGGQDSLSLLKIMLDLKKYYQWTIGLVYFDHKLRKDSYFNLKQLLNISRATRSKLYIYENFSKINTELEYREWRYEVLFYITYTYCYSTLFIAHTITDLCETFIHYIFRGCNIDSVANINASTKYNTTFSVNIIRPLLNIKRVDTSWLCKKFCLPLWSDYTNYECRKTRNRLREELIPYIQQYFQPKICSKIDAFIKTTQLDMEYLRKATIKLYYLVKHPCFIAIHYVLLLSQPSTLQYRVLRLFFKHNFNIVITRSVLDNIITNLFNKRHITHSINIWKFQLFFTDSWLYVLTI